MSSRSVARWMLGGVLCAVVAVLGPVPSAASAAQTEVIEGSYLRLVSVADWGAAAALVPGQTVTWDVTVSAEAPDPGQITLAISAEGDLPLNVDALLCPDEWLGDVCTEGALILRSAWELPRDGSLITLSAVSADDVAHLRLDVVAGSADAGSVSTQVRVHATGAGESVSTGPEGLAATGAEFPMALALGAVVLTGCGVALLGFYPGSKERAER